MLHRFPTQRKRAWRVQDTYLSVSTHTHSLCACEEDLPRQQYGHPEEEEAALDRLDAYDSRSCIHLGRV